jgi:hypothetical protein
MGFLSFRQLAVTACWCRRSFSFFRTLFVQVAATAPQTTGRLLAVYSNVVEILAVMALRKHILSFIVLYPDCGKGLAL